ncbi:secretory pathway protein Sec39-domain-containing protein [Sporodiniella umbellata]|nr:secretory pathway protein Sec39-domain-containing protein [Sporodiniella umbellata]
MEQPSTRDLLIHIKQENFQAALELADELGLEKEMIYKLQWNSLLKKKNGHPDLADVKVLVQVSDDAWCARQGLEVVMNSVQGQAELFRVCYARTQRWSDGLVEQPVPTEWTLEEKTWLRIRWYYLDTMDRFKTLTEIDPDMGHYETWRESPLLVLAIEAARNENSALLNALFLRHGQRLLPYRLSILSQLPVTSDLSGFDLPQVSEGREVAWLQTPWRAMDRVEEPWVQQLLGLENPCEPTMEDSPYPASEATIADWYSQRAQAADAIGLCGRALEISRYAQAMGIQQPIDLSDYDWLCKYVYASHAGYEVDLARFRQLSDEAVLEGLLRHTTTATVVSDLQRLGVPWVERCGRTDRLMQWLLARAEEDLEGCCQVCEQSKPTMEERIVQDDGDLSRLVLSILYFNDGLRTDLLVRLFECLPIFPDSVAPSAGEVSSIATLLADATTPLALFHALQQVGPWGLTQMMDRLQEHLSSAEVLSRYHAHVPLRWFLQEHTASAQHRLCTRMASQAAGGVETGGAQFNRDDDWRELLDDMIRMQAGIFSQLPLTEILALFFSALLRCGRFKLAKELMLDPSPQMEMSQAEGLVVDAAREFFDNATLGDMDSGGLKQAWDCLNILPPTPEIEKEKALIEATHILITEFGMEHRPGLALMPIQVRQAPDRLAFVSKLASAQRDVYKQYEKVLQLVHRLGYAQDDVLAEVKALATLASAAMVEEDYPECYQLCRRTVEKALEKPPRRSRAYYQQIDQAAWQICFNLGKLDTFDAIHPRLDVLSMALSLSPVENIPDVLDVWRRLDATHPSQIELAQLDPTRYEAQASPRWQGLLQNASKQWGLGDILKGGEPGEGKRKRDLVRNVVGGWLF